MPYISCAARNVCSFRNTKKEEKVLFHRFPENPWRKLQWINALKSHGACTQDWLPVKSSRLCSKHFTSSDYAALKLLNVNAVPSIFIRPSITSTEGSIFKPNVYDHNSGVQFEPEAENYDPLHCVKVELKNEIEEITIPSQSENFEEFHLQESGSDLQDISHIARHNEPNGENSPLQVAEEVKNEIQEINILSQPENFGPVPSNGSYADFNAVSCIEVFASSPSGQQQFNPPFVLNTEDTGDHLAVNVGFAPKEPGLNVKLSSDTVDNLAMGVEELKVKTAKQNRSKKNRSENLIECSSCKCLILKNCVLDHQTVCLGEIKRTESLSTFVQSEDFKPLKKSKRLDETTNKTAIDVDALGNALGIQRSIQPIASQVAIQEYQQNLPRVNFNHSTQKQNKATECFIIRNKTPDLFKKLEAANKRNERKDRQLRMKDERIGRLLKKISKLKDLLEKNRKCKLSDGSDTDTCDSDSSPPIDAEQTLSNRQEDVSIEGDMEDTTKKDPLIFRYKCKRVDGGYECNLCQKFCKGKLSIFTHIKKECQFPHFVCPICNTQFNNVTNIKRHLTLHSTSRNHTCKTCNMAFTNKTNLRAHRRIHSGRFHKCTECDVEYRNAAALYFHVKKNHEIKNELLMLEKVEYEHVCEICNERFKFAQHLKFHMERHSGIIHSCDQCGKEFTTAIALMSHFTRRKCSKGKSAEASVSIDQFADDSDSFHTEEILPSQKTNIASSSSNADGSVPSQSSKPTKNKDAKVKPSKVKERTTLSFADEVTEGHKQFCSEGLDSYVNEENSKDESFGTTEEVKRPFDSTNDDVTNKKLKVKSQLLAECPSCKLLFVTDIMQEHQKLCSENFDLLLEEAPPIPHKKSERPIEEQKKSKKEEGNSDALEDENTDLRIDIRGLKNALGIDEKVGIKRGPDVTELALLDEVTKGKKRKRPWANKTKGLWQQLDPSEVEGDNPAPKGDLVFKYKCKRVGTKYVCNLCNAEFEGKRFFFSHALRDCPFPHYQCTVCNINCKTSTDLKVHLRVHATARDFVCDTCAMAFQTQNALKTHLIIHSDEMPFKCTECDYACKRKDYLISHERKHKKIRLPDESKLKFMCHLCSRRYNSEKRLNLHIELHSGSKAKYVCEKCGKAHATGQGLKMHLTKNFCENVLNHENKKEKIRNYTRDWHRRHKNDPGKFQCEICAKLFRNQSFLKAHYDTHSTGKNYQCNLCSKQFKMKNSLKRHVASHGELKLACEHCDRRFVSPSELRMHMQSHSNERPFVCRCGKSFKFKGDLTCHLKKCNEMVGKGEYLEIPGRGISYYSLVSNNSPPRKRFKRW